MKLDIKFVPILARYILPIIEIILLLGIHEILISLGKNNILDSNTCYQLYKLIMSIIFVFWFILIFKYLNKKTIAIQFIVLLIYYFFIIMDNVWSYRIIH